MSENQRWACCGRSPSSRPAMSSHLLEQLPPLPNNHHREKRQAASAPTSQPQRSWWSAPCRAARAMGKMGARTCTVLILYPQWRHREDSSGWTTWIWTEKFKRQLPLWWRFPTRGWVDHVWCGKYTPAGTTVLSQRRACRRRERRGCCEEKCRLGVRLA